MEPLSDSDGPVKIGALFQGYRIVALLGQGGYASVYHARREFTDRDVAIKISNRAVTHEVFKRFQAEARLTLSLDHPNIVKVQDAAVATSGHIYIVMELLRGQTYWHARKQHGKFTIPEALHLCVEAADGVEQAHRVGVIHRDLKPLNLFIIARNRSKVLDFGIAKIPNDGDRSSTQRNLVHGTLKYMSPEQLMAETLKVQSDIYALAVIFFELITGRHPQIAENEQLTDAQLGFAIVSRAAASLAAIDPSIPSYIVEVIEKALSKDPARRFASMAEFAEALRKCYARYVQEFPEFAELRELWIPAPTASAVVRSEPPSQRHIATAVVAVVPAQSLRPTVRVDTVPAPAEPQREPEKTSIAVIAEAPVQVAAAPASVTDGGAVTSASLAPVQRPRSGRSVWVTLRRMVALGVVVGFAAGVGLTIARLEQAPSPTPSSVADGRVGSKATPPATVLLGPAASVSSSAIVGPMADEPVPVAVESEAVTAPTQTSPRTNKPVVTQRPRVRPSSTDRGLDDRVNWFNVDSRKPPPLEPKSGL